MLTIFLVAARNKRSLRMLIYTGMKMMFNIPRYTRQSLLTVTIVMMAALAYIPSGQAEGIMTGNTGTIVGTVPTFSNQDGETGKVSFSKSTSRSASAQLDVGDTLNVSWVLMDREGDADASLATVLWVCEHPQKGRRILATAVSSYTLSSEDMGCTISVEAQPVTATGNPRENTVLKITDISAYDDKDNIIDGPVNPHAIKITNYTVAPGTSQSRTVSADLLLNTAWEGAQLQLETDNQASQVTWQSSNDDIATITSDGLVKFRSKGPVTFTARHDEVMASITFNPTLFYIFNSEGQDWYEATTWCEAQGYKMPNTDQLTSGENVRNIPGTSLWEEWGDVSEQHAKHHGLVFWSANVWSDSTISPYMYLEDGHMSSNIKTLTEGTACVLE